MTGDLHDDLCAILASDLLAAFVIRMVEREALEEAQARPFAQAIAADPGRFEALVKRGYDWLDDFAAMTDDLRIALTGRAERWT